MPDQQTLIWTLLFLPLATAAVLQLLLKSKPSLACLVGTFSSFAGLAIAILLVNKPTCTVGFEWAHISANFSLNLGLVLDDLSSRMMIVVAGIGSLVHLFSIGYMKKDEARTRYFAGLSIFLFSMTGIVLANNFFVMFVFWELVGMSSYLLIGHWYKKPSAADAAKKAFITNRVGDFGFLIGILLLWSATGTLVFSEMGQGMPGLSAGMLSAGILCVFCGAVGKSAQFPLHVWLPDAMEGPTPVSALIHAATMVAAGVYMLVRVQTSLGAAAFTEVASQTIAWIGAITALLAALMATQQNDIKKILAYSTLSQLGYMVMAVGLRAGDAAMFHLFTHAWFKALLFLGSGAVIYACHHEQDIWKMGGLSKKMRLTTLTFALGTASLIAIPGTAGFFSKESILTAAKNTPFFYVAAGVAALTTFYMLRLFFVAFLGKPRSENSSHAHEVGGTMLLPLLILAVAAVIAGFPYFAQFVPFPGFHAHEFHVGPEFFASLIALALGAGMAFVFYFKKDRDLLAGNPLARLFANKFYIDEFYAKIVKVTQDTVAAVIDFFDQFLIGGILVGGSSRLVVGIGNIFRRIQSGSLSTYAFLLGLGILAVVYFTVFFQ